VRVSESGLRVVAGAGPGSEARFVDGDGERVIFIHAVGAGRGERDGVKSFAVGNTLPDGGGELIVGIEYAPAALRGKHLQAQVAGRRLGSLADPL
jgi:hypothetical protein